MARHEELTSGPVMEDMMPGGLVTIVDIRWNGSTVPGVSSKDSSGRRANEFLYWDCEPLGSQAWISIYKSHMTLGAKADTTR